MAVRIRLKRMGKIHAPVYRVVVVDSRKKRDGRVIEEVGLYDPTPNPSTIEIKSDRVQYADADKAAAAAQAIKDAEAAAEKRKADASAKKAEEEAARKAEEEAAQAAAAEEAAEEPKAEEAGEEA